MPRPQDRFPANDRKVLRRLDESAIRQVSLGILATFASFVAIVLIGDLWRHQPRLTVLFGGGMVLVGLLQAGLIIGFESFYPRGPQRWRRRFAVTLQLRAAVWSAFTVALLLRPGNDQLFFLAMLLPLTLAAALAATWLADIWTVRIYLAVSLLPAIVVLLWQRTPDAWLAAVFLGVFLYALARVSDHHFRLFWRVLGRAEAAPAPLVAAGSVPARLLLRAAEEFRQPVAIVADALTLAQAGRDDPAMVSAARRAAQRLVERIEVLEDSAALLRGDRVPQPVAGSLRRRCEEAVDDIGVVAAEGGVLCTTVYDVELPARIRTDFSLLFRAVRVLSAWVLEQLPPGGELVMRFQVASGAQDDRLRCAIDLDALHLPPALRSGLDRTAQGGGMTDPDVPLPLAVAAEIARALGGRLSLVEHGGALALALDVALDVVDKIGDDGELRAALRGKSVVLAGLTPTLAEAIAAELRVLDVVPVPCEPPELVDAIASLEPLAVLLDARDIAGFVQTVRALRDSRALRGARIVALSPQVDLPLPDDVLKLAPERLRLPLGRHRLYPLLGRIGGVDVAASAGGALATARLRVLVVEDNAINQAVARGMLEKLGCDIEMLDSGEPAVERVRRGGLDLVLMDGEMPGMDGSEATRRIRAWEQEGNRPRLPIVAMTAHTGDSEVAGFLAAGMDDVIAKPVSLASLAARIDRFRPRR